MSTTIKIRRDTAANWTANNPILSAGEKGIESDTKKEKFGDGATAWNSLEYQIGTLADQDENNVELTGTVIYGYTNEVKMGTRLASTYGWRDLTIEVDAKGAGAANPTWGTFRDGLKGYGFAAAAMNEVWGVLHINHDYAPGTEIFLHIHWAPNTVSTGTVRWGFEYTVAKGHQQASGSDFPASTTLYIEQNIASNKQYRHHIAELATGFSTNLEPDSLVLLRVFRDAVHVNDTFPDIVYGLVVDAHYQFSKVATKNKAPDFYA